MRGRVNLTSNRLVLKMAPIAGIIVLLKKLLGMGEMMVKTLQGRMRVFLTKYSCQLFQTCNSVDL